MPLYRINNKIVYFCHVPKTAGTAIEDYLTAQFGPPAFLDRAFSSTPVSDRWTKSSPQHVDALSFGSLFPDNFVDETFALVRHPATRLVSVFKFHKFIENNIPARMCFRNWVNDLWKGKIGNKWVLDNHLLSMHLLIPGCARIFRLEDGLEAVREYFQGIAGSNINLPSAFEHINVTHARLQYLKIDNEEINIDDETFNKIFDLYYGDFERFGYKHLITDK